MAGACPGWDRAFGDRHLLRSMRGQLGELLQSTQPGSHSSSTFQSSTIFRSSPRQAAACLARDPAPLPSVSEKFEPLPHAADAGYGPSEE
jgi:hypothetical protein